jgi:antitoxin component of MazEF toxin-antitoxin module
VIDKVTVDRNRLKVFGGSLYVHIPARIADAVDLNDNDVAAFDREVLEGGELGMLTIRIERPSEKRDVN